MKEPFYIERLIQKAIDDEKARFKGSEKEFEKAIRKKIPRLISSLIEGLYKVVYKYCLDENNDLKKREREILKKIDKRYSDGIRLFEAFIELNTKISSYTYDKYFQIFDSIEDHLKLDTLIALHVRACQISNEINVLVKNGYADGAFARWRTLHEICVTFLFLYDSDYDTIEMYNDFEIMEKLKKAQNYEQLCNELNWTIEDFNLKELLLAKDKLIEKYGKDFIKDYGWTKKHLKEPRTFKELEKKVSKDYLRTVYAWSCESVYAGVSGIRYKHSLRKKEQYNFLTSSNDYGFTDPVQFTSYSLLEMSQVLLGMEDSIMNNIYDELLIAFQNKLVKEFCKKEKYRITSGHKT
jgi:hypothetical protein